MDDDRRKRECGHCGRSGATAWAAGVHLCHTSDLSLPDCYRRVTVWAEPPGALLGMDPKPPGTEGIIRRDGYSGLEATAMEQLVRLTEELGLYDTETDTAGAALANEAFALTEDAGPDAEA